MSNRSVRRWFVGAALALTVLVSVDRTAAWQTVNLETVTLNGGMDGPDAIVIADFNRDTLLDLAVANFRGNTVTIFINRSGRQFASPVSYAVGGGPAAIAEADLNRDGFRDLVTTNFTGGNISVLLGRGDGTFQNAQNYTAPTPHYVAIANFNNDNALDLAIVGDTSNTLSIFLNQGNGTFAAPTTTTSNNRPHAIAAGDLNGDGKSDLIIATLLLNQLDVRLGTGTGTFTQGAIIPVGALPHHVLAVDLNRDNKLDLVSCDSGTTTISVHLGRGDGTFLAPAFPNVGNGPLHVEPGDFNGDGFVDLIVSNLGSDNASLLLGNGNGAFGNANNFPAGAGTTSVATGDLDRDGKSDAATVNVNANTVTLLFSGPVLTVGFEADVAPRPNGSSGTVTMTDWVQIGRFVAGLDTVTAGSEFQRADCAPRTTLGNGRISVSDWVQAGRYSAGLDPVIVAGGPTAPSASALFSTLDEQFALHAPQRVLPRILQARMTTGDPQALTLALEAVGDENAASFSLEFDPQQVRFSTAALSEQCSAGQLIINTQQAAEGRVGFVLLLPTGARLTAGATDLLTIRFDAPMAEGGINFGDEPVARELVNDTASPVPARYLEPVTSFDRFRRRLR